MTVPLRSVLATAVAILLAAACSPGGPDSTPKPRVTPALPRVQPQDCSVSAKLIPTCGALLGVSAEPGGDADVAALERKLGRKFDLVYEFHGIDKPLPARDEERMVAEGRVLHVNIEAKEFGQATHPDVAWSRIVAGEFDQALRAQATGLAALGSPVMVTFDQEVDSPKRVGQRGTAAEFVAAWRHIHRLYAAAGARNIVWVWVVTGYEGNLDAVGSVYPGNEYVDWLSWDPYNMAGCQTGKFKPAQWRSFADSVEPFYGWLQTEGARAGIDKAKPYLLSEFGTVANPDDPSASARWYAELPAALERFPQVKAVQLWNGEVGACDFRIEKQPAALDTFGQVARTPTFTSAKR
jgi:hypothetical protein